MSSDYLFLIFGIIHVALGQTIDEKPEDKTSCVGRDVEIPWHFKDETNLNIATWSVTSSALTGNILRKIGSASATILNSYNVVHNSNGKITLTSLTTDNSGTFKLSVTYNSATTAEEDTVELTVSETPTATLRCEDGSCQFDGGTTLGLVLSTEVNETRKYCCVTGAAAACIDGSTGTKYCIEVPSTTSTTDTLPDTNTTHPTTSMSTTGPSSDKDFLPDWAKVVIPGVLVIVGIIVITIITKIKEICCFKKNISKKYIDTNKLPMKNIEQSTDDNEQSRETNKI